ncbi:hypothetical protein H0H81_001745 [Sphagnurus paluster]|uniref:Uncharacterized protein n=1 Tax=Sphagnurus paluster TaxID=117069 RepID=A0A9P7KJP3_9AGAR|nr:hypothetical protein H0H81_001745 [Sphagnurus paluster]
MPETQLDDDVDSGHAPGKRKTTYPRDHPTNPKGPKRSRAEIQQAAKQRNEAKLAKKEATELEKKRKLLEAKEKRKLSAQRIAAVEDTVQHSEKQCQLHSERPDLQTMETYREELEKRQENQSREQIADQDDIIDQQEEDNMYLDAPNLPPESIVDTDSDGARLGLSDPGSDEEDAYKLSGHEEENEGSHRGDDTDDSMAKLYVRLSEKIKQRKKKENGKLQAEIQAHRKATAKPRTSATSSATAASSITAAPTAKSRSIWQKQVPDQPSDSDGAEATEQVDGGRELGADEDDVVLEAARKDKQVSGGMKKVHRSGTKAMGIKLKTADITAIKRDASARRSAKLRYNNGHLPFENPTRDLQTWRTDVIPAIIDWVGTLEDPFAANSHPDLPDLYIKRA